MIDKSLVRMGEDERYGLHPLFQQYVVEQLTAVPDVERQVTERHSIYFLQLIEANQGALPT